MENQDLRVVEINGVKIEVDMRTAKRVDQYKVGDQVKVLVKEYSSYKPHSGVIVGFDEFKNLPTITVAYIKESYNEVEMAFVGINSKTEDIEIAPLQDQDKRFDYNKALNCFDSKIIKAERELEDIKNKKSWFKNNYNTLFGDFFNTPSDEL